MNSEIRNVSFVVIAKNEGNHIHRCLDSILQLNLFNCEIICVDSASSDSTLDIMKKYAVKNQIVKIRELKHCLNAAQARNEGAKISKGDIVGFIDGDIEMNSVFIQQAINCILKKETNAVVGDLDEIYYNSDSTKIEKKIFKRYNIKEKQFISKCGGILFVENKVISEIGLYDERFFINEDLDFSLRISNTYKLLALPISMGIHHTQSYKKRKELFLFNGNYKNVGMLLGKHITKKGIIKTWLKGNKISLLGVLFLSVLVISVLIACVVKNAIIFLLTLSIISSLQIIYAFFRKHSIRYVLLMQYLGTAMIISGFFREILYNYKMKIK